MGATSGIPIDGGVRKSFPAKQFAPALPCLWADKSSLPVSIGPDLAS